MLTMPVWLKCYVESKETSNVDVINGRRPTNWYSWNFCSCIYAGNAEVVKKNCLQFDDLWLLHFNHYWWRINKQILSAEGEQTLMAMNDYVINKDLACKTHKWRFDHFCMFWTFWHFSHPALDGFGFYDFFFSRSLSPIAFMIRITH